MWGSSHFLSILWKLEMKLFEIFLSRIHFSGFSFFKITFESFIIPPVEVTVWLVYLLGSLFFCLMYRCHDKDQRHVRGGPNVATGTLFTFNSPFRSTDSVSEQWRERTDKRLTKAKCMEFHRRGKWKSKGPLLDGYLVLMRVPATFRPVRDRAFRRFRSVIGWPCWRSSKRTAFKHYRLTNCANGAWELTKQVEKTELVFRNRTRCSVKTIVCPRVECQSAFAEVPSHRNGSDTLAGRFCDGGDRPTNSKYW